jgi:hypothetical protein
MLIRWLRSIANIIAELARFSHVSPGTEALIISKRFRPSSPSAGLGTEGNLQHSAFDKVGMGKPELVQWLAVQLYRLDVDIGRGIVPRDDGEFPARKIFFIKPDGDAIKYRAGNLVGWFG